MTFTFTYCFLKVTWGPHGSKAAEMLFKMQILGALLVCNVSRLKKKQKKKNSTDEPVCRAGIEMQR